jgi:hypothetical protein
MAFSAAPPTWRRDVDYDMFAGQAGMDLYYAEGPDGGSDRAGIYGAIGNASSPVRRVGRLERQ